MKTTEAPADRPDLSLIVPMHDSGRTLEATVRSLAAETRLSREFVFVDDGSGDGSAELARALATELGLEARVLSLGRNLGVGAARNRGAREARGRYLWFFDADDLLTLGAYRVVERLLESEPDAAAAGYVQFFSSWDYGIPAAEASPAQLESAAAAGFLEMYLKGRFSPLITTCLFSAGLGPGKGLLFSERFKYGEDTDFMIRAFAAASRVAWSPAPIAVYLRWPFSASAMRDLGWYDAPRAMMAAFRSLESGGFSPRRKRAILAAMLLKQLPQAYFHAYYSSRLRERGGEIQREYRRLAAANRRLFAVRDAASLSWLLRSLLLLASARLFLAASEAASWFGRRIVPRLRRGLGLVLHPAREEGKPQ